MMDCITATVCCLNVVISCDKTLPAVQMSRELLQIWINKTRYVHMKTFKGLRLQMSCACIVTECQAEDCCNEGLHDQYC